MLKVRQRYSKLVNVLPFSTFLKADEEILLSRPLHDTIYGHHLPHSLLGTPSFTNLFWPFYGPSHKRTTL